MHLIALSLALKLRNFFECSCLLKHNFSHNVFCKSQICLKNPLKFCLHREWGVPRHLILEVYTICRKPSKLCLIEKELTCRCINYLPRFRHFNKGSSFPTEAEFTVSLLEKTKEAASCNKQRQHTFLCRPALCKLTKMANRSKSAVTCKTDTH